MKVIQAKKQFAEICNDMDWSLPYRTPLGKKSLHVLYQYGLMANAVEGVAAEAGVFSGYSLMVLARVFDREIHAFDTFRGLPEPSDKDGAVVGKGSFALDIATVQSRLSFTDKIVYHEGLFCDKFPEIDPDIKFAYVFCDVDLYQSVIECFEFFYPRMNPGGVLLFDDYSCSHTPGATLAIDEMADKYNVKNAFSTDLIVVIEVS